MAKTSVATKKPAKKKKSAKRKSKPAELKIKITQKQKQQLKKICKLNQTTIAVVVKKSITSYLKYYADELKEDKTISKNQLKLFGSEKDTGQQMLMDM